MSIEGRVDNFENDAAKAAARITAKTNFNLLTRESVERRVRRYRAYSACMTLLAAAAVGYGVLADVPATEPARLLGMRPSADLKVAVTATTWDRTVDVKDQMIVIDAYATSSVPADSGMWWWVILPADGEKPSNAQAGVLDTGRKVWAIPAEEAQWIDRSNSVRNAVPGCELKPDPSKEGRWLCGGLHSFSTDHAGDPIGIAVGSVKSWNGAVSFYGGADVGTRGPLLSFQQPNQ